MVHLRKSGIRVDPNTEPKLSDYLTPRTEQQVARDYLQLDLQELRESTPQNRYNDRAEREMAKKDQITHGKCCCVIM
ncbi:hypothetical protein L596_030779 [Steinernema carpocapsae]|uniref:Uncharacterized protein n=1 Tax=Steinernema carpocapsae TaxID=34508 RepID=A0A4U5LNQ2_STECR|nr:hypothetical protein L596_030779 [Steinernema carpocapsae]